MKINHTPTPVPGKPLTPEQNPAEISLGLKMAATTISGGILATQAYVTYDLLSDGFMTPDSIITKGVVALEVGAATYAMIKTVAHAVAFRAGVRRARNFEDRSNAYHAAKAEKSRLQRGYTANTRRQHE